MKKRLKKASSESLYLSVYLTNLGKYNEGDLVGNWVEVDGSTDWEAELKNIGISSEPDAEGNIYEESFISDYESNIPNISSELGEHPSFDTLDEIGEFISGNVDADLFRALYESLGDFDDTKRAMENGDYTFAPDVHDDENLGYYLVDEVFGGANELPKETLENYFDYESYGRDARLESSGMFTDYGYIETH